MMSKDEEYQIHRNAAHRDGPAHLKTFQNKTRAYNHVDKLDNEYGSYAHSVKRIPKTMESLEKLGMGKPYGEK